MSKPIVDGPPFAIMRVRGRFNSGHDYISEGGCAFVCYADSYEDGVNKLIQYCDNYRDLDNTPALGRRVEEDGLLDCKHTPEVLNDVGGFVYMECRGHFENGCESPFILLPMVPKKFTDVY